MRLFWRNETTLYAEDESKNTVKKINEVPEDVLRKILEE
jgi:hypothetical protein